MNTLSFTTKSGAKKIKAKQRLLLRPKEMFYITKSYTGMKKISPDIITALILTYNEEDNIERVLNRLQWLEGIIIIDSHSTDRTLAIATNYPNVKVYSRTFDTHATQWNYGLSLTNSKWILSLDADYILTDDFVNEIQKNLSEDKSAFFTKFKFLVFGKKLLSDNTTPRPVLFKRQDCIYYDDGHTQRLKINGSSGFFKTHILHDDRKSLSRWLNNQDKYSIKECDKLLNFNNGGKGSVINKNKKNKKFSPLFFFFFLLFFLSIIFYCLAGWGFYISKTLVVIIFAFP